MTLPIAPLLASAQVPNADLVLVFLFVLAVVVIKQIASWHQRKLWHETARAALEKGQPLPFGDEDPLPRAMRKLKYPGRHRRGTLLRSPLGARQLVDPARPDRRRPGDHGASHVHLPRRFRQPRSVTDTDQQLVERVRLLDDRDAFGELVKRHQSAVRRFSRALLQDDSLADDVAQESFVRAYRSMGAFRGDSSVLTWLLGIAHNQARNARRKKKDHLELDPNDPSLAAPADATRSSDLKNDLERALAQLSADERAALHLCFQEDLSHTEAAAALGWPLGTLKTHVARGKERLKLLMTSWNPTV